MEFFTLNSIHRFARFLAHDCRLFRRRWQAASPRALVAVASDAGALGSFGFAYTQPEAMARDIAAVSTLSKGPGNANFFVCCDWH
jgi:hypothetical protein